MQASSGRPSIQASRPADQAVGRPRAPITPAPGRRRGRESRKAIDSAATHAQQPSIIDLFGRAKPKTTAATSSSSVEHVIELTSSPPQHPPSSMFPQVHIALPQPCRQQPPSQALQPQPCGQQRPQQPPSHEPLRHQQQALQLQASQELLQRLQAADGGASASDDIADHVHLSSTSQLSGMQQDAPCAVPCTTTSVSGMSPSRSTQQAAGGRYPAHAAAGSPEHRPRPDHVPSISSPGKRKAAPDAPVQDEDDIIILLDSPSPVKCSRRQGQGPSMDNVQPGSQDSGHQIRNDEPGLGSGKQPDAGSQASLHGSSAGRCTNTRGDHARTTVKGSEKSLDVQPAAGCLHRADSSGQW